MMTDDEVVRNILLAIRFLALTPYPFAEGAQTDPRYALALGGIAGLVEEALTAVAEDRKMRLFPGHQLISTDPGTFDVPKIKDADHG